jgi:hypothetical protein
MSIIKQQDEALLGLDEAVGRLDHMGRAINTELKEQVHQLLIFGRKIISYL